MAKDKLAVQPLIDDLTRAIGVLKESPAVLDGIEAKNPELGETELYQEYKAQLEQRLEGVNPRLVLSLLEDSFSQIRRGKSGSNPEHGGIA